MIWHENSKILYPIKISYMSMLRKENEAKDNT